MKKAETLIQSWEKEEDFPTYTQLEQLADIYNKPLAIFFLSNPPILPSAKTSFRTVPDTIYESFNSNIIKIINSAEVMKFNLIELNDGINPASPFLLDMLHKGSYKTLVSDIRNILSVSLTEQKRIRKAEFFFELFRGRLADMGMFVFKAPFQYDKVSGFCLFDRKFPIIYINNSMTFTRQLFTMFHELYHLINDISGMDYVDDEELNYYRDDTLAIEQECNYFAAEFLVPYDDFREELKLISINDEGISYLAQRYLVSREVVMRRLLDMGKITRDYYNTRRLELINEAKRKKEKEETGGGNYYYNQIAYLGDSYLKLVFKSYKSNKIDKYKVSEYTNIKVSNLSELEAKWNWRGGK